MIASINKVSARQRRYNITGWLFCLPAAILGVIFLVVPIVLAFVFSFTDYHMQRGISEFVWFANYSELFRDEVFGKAILNTIQFVIYVVPLQCGLALGLALLVNKTAKGFGVFKLAYFAPVITSMTVIALLFMNFYNTNGMFNLILQALNLPTQGFLNDPNQAMGSIIAMSVWQGAGYQMIILLAALQNVQPELYEAASLDGANSAQKFRHVTLPGILQVGSFVLLITVIGAFKLFTQPYIMTQGGPDSATMTVVLYIYERGMADKLVGYGSSIAMLFTLVFIIASGAGKLSAKGIAAYFKRRSRVIEESL